MSLLAVGGVAAAKVVGLAAVAKYGGPHYLLGCAVLGSEPDPERVTLPRVEVVPVVRASSFWTSVAAGLTAASIFAAASYAYAKFRGRSHFLEGSRR